jgi:hypothetical protein
VSCKQDALHKSQNFGKGMVTYMSYVAPAIKEKFETLSIDLKNNILDRNVELYTIHDLINVLDDIVKEGEQEENSASR